MKDLIRDIRKSLEEFADDKRIEFAKKSYPTRMQVIGVIVPNLKIVVKELSKQTKSFDNQKKLELIKLLIDEDVFELQQVAFEYLQSEKSLYKSLTEEFVESIEKNLDNWLSVDYFGAIVVGCAWRENLITTEKVKSYLKSNDFWIRRIAVVATVSLNQKARGGRGDSKRTLEICRLVVDDHHDMIVKALSWALRELSKIDKDSVIEFINENRNSLHKKVLREVNSKLETGLKN
ncbi:MAG TPA: DNA alkylation repair protein [Tenuifilaceae bacterium]|nr:DNA alkylation repair protein [Tenuifilaceae bacterium]HPJ46975.1 DNA alkylation repair protein [Tenuifilaceae bacterium]HRX69201.1 DNA alkylation repair protein [Tenuifilaceae bacterium]